MYTRLLKSYFLRLIGITAAALSMAACSSHESLKAPTEREAPLHSANQQSAAVSEILLGQNHWMADGDEGRVGYLHKLWPAVKLSGVKVVRIGGNGYEKSFPSFQKLERMITNVRSAGAEPLIQIPRDFTVAEAKSVVRRFTGAENFVQYWSVGNEPMLHDELTLDEVFQYLSTLGPAMREVSSEITILAYDEAFMKKAEYAAIVGGQKDITGFKVNDRWVYDGITFHNYPNGKSFTREDVVLRSASKIEQDIQYLKGLIREANAKHGRQGDDALEWGLTEFNVTWHNPDRAVEGFGNPSFLGGQFTAEVFGLGMKYGALMMNPWCINETDRVTTDFGYLGLPDEFHPRSSYYHMQLISDYMGSRYIHSATQDPELKVIATISGQAYALMLMNQAKHESKVVRIYSSTMNADEVLKSDVIIEGALNASVTMALPPQTTKVIQLNTDGHVLSEIVYSLDHNLKHLPPERVRGAWKRMSSNHHPVFAIDGSG